jgi:hypothetical protein
VAKKALDVQAEQGREVVKLISSAQAIQDANAQLSPLEGSVDVYA